MSAQLPRRVSLRLHRLVCLGVSIGVAGSFVLGCAEADDVKPLKPPVPGGSVRVVNLTLKPVTYSINRGAGTRIDPSRAGVFTLQRPSRPCEVTFDDPGLEPVKLTVESGQTHSVIVYDTDHGPSVSVSQGDPREPSRKTICEVGVSSPEPLAGAVLTIAGTKAHVPIGRCELIQMPDGRHRVVLTVDGAEVATGEVDARRGRSFSIVVVPGGQGRLFISWNNPPQDLGQGGASDSS